MQIVGPPFPGGGLYNIHGNIKNQSNNIKMHKQEREGWLNSVAPHCTKIACQTKNCRSYCSKRSDTLGWCWRFRCCRRRQSILLNSMFYQGNLQPGNILEILWKVSSRTPVTIIPLLIYVRLTSGVYNHIE